MAIQGAHGLDKMKIEELIASLMAHEQCLKEYDNEDVFEKKKNIALNKGVVDSDGEDSGDGSSKEIIMISN